jgi:ketosteroid isomerase-like protein
MAENTQLVRRVFDAINAHDLDALGELWAPDGVERFPDATCSGFAEIRAHFEGLFAALPDFHMDVVATAEEGDAVFARWRLTGTHTGAAFAGIERTGARVELDGMDHFTVAGGKVESNFVIFDQMEVGRALGLLPPDGSGADRALKAAFNAKTKVAEAIRQARG